MVKTKLISETKKLTMLFLLFVFAVVANFLYLQTESPGTVRNTASPVEDIGSAGGL